MATAGGASAAIEGLHRKHTWEGLAAPMVVERCCAARLGVKAATQQATRARRTALAAAARRAARGAGAGWHGASGPLMALPGGGGVGVGPGASAGLPYILAPPPGGAGAAGFSAPLSAYSGPLPPAGAAAYGGLPLYAAAPPPPMPAARGLLPDAPHSTPLPLLRAHSGPASSSLGYSTASSSAVAVPPGPLYAPSSGYASSPYGSPYAGSPPDASAALGLAPPGSAGMMPPYLSHPGAAAAAAAAAAQQPPGLPDGGAAGAAPLCGLALQSPEQVSLVAEHAATLSALSGAAFWLQPAAPGAPCGSLALSGGPAQVAAAADLISQLLLRGGGPGAGGAQAAPAAHWP
jgi:hypothetical protein